MAQHRPDRLGLGNANKAVRLRVGQAVDEVLAPHARIDQDDGDPRFEQRKG